jgi:hypothetical protein
MPIVVSMHYEMDARGASRFLARGTAVLTPHGSRSYTASNLMGHGINHSIAMARMPLRMPFIDPGRIMLFGGSAGGYHALMASSYIFPAIAVYAAVPPLNFRYNVNYLIKNDEVNVNPDDPTKPPAPVVKVVKPIAEESAKGGGIETQSWRHFSPVYRTHLMPFRTLITYITADALVPVQQLSKDLAREPEAGTWPDGFTFSMDDLAPSDEAASLLEVLGEKDYSIKIVKTPPDSPTLERTRQELDDDEVSKITTTPLKWSKTRRFSIYVLDEGAPEPYCGHAKYHHGVDDGGFIQYHLTRPTLPSSILTEEKLRQLMERFSGCEPDQGAEYEGKKMWPITRLDHEPIERWYVTAGLEAYASGSERNMSRLVRTYRRLPEKLRSLDLDPKSKMGRFDGNPTGILLGQQLLALIGSGDLRPAKHLMRRSLAAS